MKRIIIKEDDSELIHISYVNLASLILVKDSKGKAVGFINRGESLNYSVRTCSNGYLAGLRYTTSNLSELISNLNDDDYDCYVLN